MKTLRLLISAIFIVMLFGCSDNVKVEYSTNLSDKEEYDVIVMGGQSNMVGLGKQTDLEKMKFANITFYDLGLSSDLTDPEGNFGPEVGLSMELTKQFPNRKFILIKYAIGGASLLDWSPNYDYQKAKITGNPKFGNMYNKLLSITDSLTRGYNVNMKAFLWMQGERDARIPEAGIDYYQNFELLINSIRKDLKNPKMPIIYGKINPPKESYPALDTVVNAQKRINEEVTNTYIIETDTFEKWDDNLHYSSNGQVELGTRFGKIIAEILKN